MVEKVRTQEDTQVGRYENSVLSVAGCVWSDWSKDSKVETRLMTVGFGHGGGTWSPG